MIFASSFDKISGAKVILRSKYTKDVTHIISDCNDSKLCPRTVKYLRGLLEGRWIISYDWFLASLSANKFIDEVPYLIGGDEVIGFPTNAPWKSIKSHQANPGIGLFDKMTFFLIGSFRSPSAPSKADIVKLIIAGGGKVINSRPKIPSKDYWIVYDPDSSLQKEFNFDDEQHLTWSRLLDCISHYSTDFLYHPI